MKNHSVAVEPFQLLQAHEALLQPLLQGHFAAEPSWLEQSADPCLSLWLKATLKQVGTAEEYAQLPAEQAACWQGWRAYYAGNYQCAWQHFQQGWQCIQHHSAAVYGTALPVDLALGFGKVFTRTGHWHTARLWLLHALELARTGDRLFDCVRGYGALGELLLRAGYPQQALFCLGTAHQLLPPGAGERSRQWNYLASALLRLQTERDQQAAESLLMSSFYLALDDGNDCNSACHSLARLQFLELDRQGHQDIVISLHAQKTLDQASETVPKGFLALGRGFAAWLRGERFAAQQHAADACQHFSRHLGEAFWAAHFHQLVTATESDSPPALPCVLIEPDAIAVPASQSVVDSLWQNLPLPNTGHAIFAPASNDIVQLIAHREKFFL